MVAVHVARMIVTPVALRPGSVIVKVLSPVLGLDFVFENPGLGP